MYVNGVRYCDITCKGTGSWDRWGDAVAKIDLNNGENSIAIKADRDDKNDCINLDYVFISKI